MSNEHFSHFSKHGRIKMAIFGLCLALGFLALRPFLTTTLSNGFDSVASIDNKISDYVYEDHYEYNKKLAQDLLQSDDPIKTMAGASHLSGWQQWAASESPNSKPYDLKTPVARTLGNNAGNAKVWLAAYPLCAADKRTCDANKVLNQLKLIAPENGMTWLYHASAALERDDFGAREMYLRKAKSSAFFDDGKNAINASWHYARAEQPYSLPWYSFLASKNLKKIETSVWAFDSYVPGCRDAYKSALSIKESCREIAKKIAQQSTSNITLKLIASSMAVKLGDTNLNAMLELLQEQNRGYYYYLYSRENKDVKALAKAYEQERLYDFAAKMAEANKQKKYPDIYEF